MNQKYRNNTPELGVIESQILNHTDFTDVDTAGYIDIIDTLPIGAIPIAWTTDVIVPFSRNVSFTGDPTTLAFVDNEGSPDTITDSADGFVTDGFLIGDEIVVAGASDSDNDITVTLTAVAAGVLTFATGSVVTEESGIADMTIVGTATVTGTISVGISGDIDRFSAMTTGSVAGTAGDVVGAACIAADACKGISAAQTIRVTVTEATDFTDFTSGSLKTNLYYINT